METNFYAHFRKYIYGWDFTEFADDGESPILYASFEDAQESLDKYIADVSRAHADGDMDSPYEDDCKVMAVKLSLPEPITNVRIIFGSTPCSLFHDGRPNEEIDQACEDNGGVNSYEFFNTKAEAVAYLKGLDDADGWGETFAYIEE